MRLPCNKTLFFLSVKTAAKTVSLLDLQSLNKSILNIAYITKSYTPHNTLTMQRTIISIPVVFFSLSSTIIILLYALTTAYHNNCFPHMSRNRRCI